MQPPAIDAHQQFWNPERVPPLGRDDFSLDAIGREAVLADSGREAPDGAN
jgi:hypothetical protein